MTTRAGSACAPAGIAGASGRRERGRRGMCCPPVRDYMIESRLYELATGGRPAVVKHHLHGISGPDGTYDWGSTLQHR